MRILLNNPHLIHQFINSHSHNYTKLTLVIAITFNSTTTPQPFYDPFSGTIRVRRCQKRTPGLFKANINRLQRVQNILAWVVARAPWTVSSLDICCDLHWLPVSHSINFKLCLLTWKTLHTACPQYLSELITHYLPPRALTFFVPEMTYNVFSGTLNPTHFTSP